MIWSGIFAPAGTPAPVIARLHEATITAMRVPEVAARFAGAGMSPSVGGPREMRDIITRERASYGELARSLRVTAGAAK